MNCQKDLHHIVRRFGKSIPLVIEKLGVGQGGSSDFSAGTRDIARGKARIKDEKYEVKLTPTQGSPNNASLFGVGPKPIFQS
jgi:hypothetical protein